MRRIYGCGSGELHSGCHAAQAVPTQPDTPPFTEATGAAAAAAAEPSSAEVAPAARSGSLASHGAVMQQQSLRQAAVSSPGLDSGSALEREMQGRVPQALPLRPLSKDGTREQGAEGAALALRRLMPEACSTSAAPASRLQQLHLSEQPSRTCIAAQYLAHGASSSSDGAQAAAAAPSLTREGIISAGQRQSTAGGKERLQQRCQASCDSRQAHTAADGLDLTEEGGQVAPVLRSQTTGLMYSQQPHRCSSDPDHAQGVSSEPLPAEAGSCWREGQRSPASGSVRLQRPHELIGRELFITASMLNHSCDPNCLVVREGGHASIVTQRPIQVHHPGRSPELYCTENHPRLPILRYCLQADGP